MRTVTAGIDDLPDAVGAVLSDPPPGTASFVEASGYSWHVARVGRTRRIRRSSSFTE